MSPSSPGSSPQGPTRVLIVLRHAKAEPYGDEDHARRLVERGEQDAGTVGSWLAEQGFVPTHALVSSAERTRRTWAIVADASGSSARAEFSDAAYTAGTESALDLLREAGAEAGEDAVLIYVGHNPTVSDLVLALDDGGADADVFRTISGGLPTAGVAVLEVPVPWADLASGTARLVAAHPRRD